MTKQEVMEDLVRRYPGMSPILILKISMAVKGCIIAENALKRIQKEDLRFTKGTPYGLSFDIDKGDFYLPGSVLFRDGSTVFINYGEDYEDPFTIDYDNEKGLFLVKENDTVLDVIDYVPRPHFFDYETSGGTPMNMIGGNGTSTKIYFNAYQRCRFWEEKTQCHYCALFTSTKVIREPDPEAAHETIMRAIEERGRFTETEVSGGTDFGGYPPFSNEVNRYIHFIKVLGRAFEGPVPIQLMAPAYKKEELKRIQGETAISSYRANIEVWDKSVFKKLCPGKEKWIGYDQWIYRLYDAVDVFGEGNVHSNIVCGAELTKPDGMTSVDAAVESALDFAENMRAHGVHGSISIWRPHKNETLGWQPMQEPEYYVRICDGFNKILHDPKRSVLAGAYKRGGDNPEGDLAMGYYAADIPVRNDEMPYTTWECFMAEGHVPELVEKMLADPTCRAYFEVSELEGGPRFLALENVQVRGNSIMLPLSSDRDRLSNYLVKKIWFRQPGNLILVCGSRAVSVSVRVWKNHIIGSVFSSVYDDMDCDIASVCELRVRDEIRDFDTDMLRDRLMDNIGGICEQHLEYRLK